MSHKTYILRHRRENLNKCSLRGLETREDLVFYTYPKDALPPLGRILLLSLGAPCLSKEDAHLPLLLIDGTWNYARVMERQLPPTLLLEKRSLPPLLRTAYPRRQEDCEDQERGLASVEALFAAYVLLGKDPSGLLDGYHWKEPFLEKNAHLLF